MRRGRREKGEAKKKRQDGDAHTTLRHCDSFFFNPLQLEKKNAKRVVRGISVNYISQLKDSDRRLRNARAVYL